MLPFAFQQRPRPGRTGPRFRLWGHLLLGGLLSLGPAQGRRVTGAALRRPCAGITIVRTGQIYPNLGAAAAAALAQDVIQVPARTYTDDFVNFTTPVTVQGVGGLAHFEATISPGNGKAIFVVNSDVTFDHIELSGCTVPDNNGAGIKQETGFLTLTNCYFHDNQNGVLTNAATTGIAVTHCEFALNGYGDGYTHNIYIGATPRATIRDSYFHDAKVGHEIKCRALTTLIEGCRIQNGDGTASYCIDLPQGGAAIVRNNIIEKGPNAQNPSIIHFGEEAVNPGSSLQVSGNTVLMLRNGYYVNSRMADGSVATLFNNRVYGLSDAQLLTGQGTVTGTVPLATPPTIDRTSLF